MADISNRTLATLLIAAIVVSLGGTLLSLNKLQSGVTGRAQTDTGTTEVTVTQAVSIIITEPTNNIIDFGEGRVNTTAACNHRANLVAYADLTASYLDVDDCWIESGSPDPHGWVVENNGNLNASFSIEGPSATSFFSYTGSYSDRLHLVWRVNQSDGGCKEGRVEAWTTFDSNTTACDNLPWDESAEDDDVGIDVNVSIPSDVPGGTYTDATIEFYAVEYP